MKHVKKVFKKLEATQLLVKIEKCEFHKHSVKFLGFTISDKGIQMDESKQVHNFGWGARSLGKHVIQVSDQ